jgi:glycosyltransferase involved in cell wall biosynthesis
MRGDSLSIVVEHMLEGWLQLDHGDELHLVVGPDPQAEIPDGVTIHQVQFGRRAFLSRLRAQSRTIPRICREIDADIVLGTLPTTTVTRLPCPRSIVIYDLRYKIRPEGFNTKSRLLRAASYRIGFAQFDSAVIISERTKNDLLTVYPKLAKRPLRVAHLGADHVDDWPVNRPATPYAIAFGHYANKNVDLVLTAWAQRHQRGDTTLPLAMVGVSEFDRPHHEQRIAELGLPDGFVTLHPWLPIETFRETFASSSLVVFPSDFEGFGLPAAEAMRLGIPVVISPDAALLEITDGHAAVMDDATPEALVRALDTATALSPSALDAARSHAQQFTWANFANGTRWLLADTVAGVTTSPTPAETPHRLPTPSARRRLIPALLGGHGHPRPFRWVAAAFAATLAVSGISAASIALVDRYRAPAPPTPSTTTTSIAAGSSTTTAHHGTSTGTVPLPNPDSSSSTSTTPTGNTSIPSSTTTSPPTSPSTTGLIPTVPPVTIPTITIPTFVLPQVACSIATSATTPLAVTPCKVTSAISVCRCG